MGKKGVKRGRGEKGEKGEMGEMRIKERDTYHTTTPHNNSSVLLPL